MIAIVVLVVLGVLILREGPEVVRKKHGWVVFKLKKHFKLQDVYAG